MSSIEILYNESQSLRLFLSARTSGSGTPQPDGYLLVEQEPGKYRAELNSGLVGEFDLWATDQTGGLVYRAYVTIDVLDAVYRPVSTIENLPTGRRLQEPIGTEPGTGPLLGDRLTIVEPEQNRMDLCGDSSQQPGYVLQAGLPSGLLWNLRGPDGQVLPATSPGRLTGVDDRAGLLLGAVDWYWRDLLAGDLRAGGQVDDWPDLEARGTVVWWSGLPPLTSQDLSDGRTRYALFRNPFCQHATYRAKLQIRSGKLLIVPPRQVSANPGIYGMEVSWLQDDQQYFGTSVISVEQTLAQRAAGPDRTGPLTIDRIRGRLRDFQEINDSGRYEWPLKEIIQAMLDPIEYYNETPPFSDAFSVSNFPYRQRYLDAVVSRLLIVQAHGLLRNQYTVQGEGVQMDNRDRNAKIMQVADQLWNDYRQFVHADKARRNAGMAYRSF